MPENMCRKEREQRLAESLQDGTQEALAELFDCYAPVLLGLITKIIKEKTAAEDVLQRTFLMIWEQRSAYNPEKTGFLTWMIMLAKEAAIESFKAGNLNKFSKKAENISWSENPVTLPFALKTDDNTEEVFCKLQPVEKAILDLIYLKGYTCREAAVEIGMPEETLIKKLRIAIKHIQTSTAS